METYKATHSLRCPMFNYSKAGVATPCGKKITGKAESTVSQADAENKAEQRCYDKFNGHVRSTHGRFTS